MQRGPGFEYRYLTEFQSHEPEFDYLKSLEIEEKINKVRWVRSSNNTKHIIATNDKTIKLWKVRHLQQHAHHAVREWQYEQQLHAPVIWPSMQRGASAFSQAVQHAQLSLRL